MVREVDGAMTVTIKEGNRHGEILPPRASVCPECGEQLLEDAHNGQVVCPHCGLVEQPYFIVEQNRSWFTAEQREEREQFGGPIHIGEATLIDRRGRDCWGTLLPDIRKWSSLNRLHTQAGRGPVKGIINARNELGRVCSVLDLPPSLQEETWVLFMRYYARRKLTGFTITDAISAATYIACRLRRIVLPQADLVKAAGVTSSEVRRGKITRQFGTLSFFRLVQRICVELGIRLPGPGDRAAEHIEHIGQKLHIAPSLLRTASEAVTRTKKFLQTGVDPRAVAGASLYLACLHGNDRRSERLIAKLAGTTEVTPRKRVKDLRGSFSLLLQQREIENQNQGV